MPNTVPERSELLERLLDLAYDVSSYMRHQAQPTIRLSAALLLAASLAACSSSPSTSPQPVAPLTQEVRSGLPTQPGEYPVLTQSLMRDQQGVYHFEWLAPGTTSGPGTKAAVSLLKLSQGTIPLLTVPLSGDPILSLPSTTQIPLATASSGSGYTYWRPFYGGGYYYGPSYYDPPSQNIPSSGTIDGSTASSAPKSAAARTVGVSHGVSGRAGGAGTGSAATNKSGASSAVGGKSGAVSGSSSSSFSGGKSGATGGGASSSS